MSDRFDYVPADLLRRALKNHDRIVAALRSDIDAHRPSRAVDDMLAVKAEAVDLGCYPPLTAILRSSEPSRPVEGCQFVEAEDGTCGHPHAATPECWQVGEDRSDCPVLEPTHNTRRSDAES